MFLNCYQSPIFEVYNSKDAKTSNGNKEKFKHYSKLIDLQTSVYEYNSILKTYLLCAKQIKLPQGREQELSLVSPIIGFQGQFQDSLHIELFIVDTKSTRRRIILNSLKKSECKPFYITQPITTQSAYQNWVTILIDLPSFVSQFKGSSYRSLEAILIQSQCYLRRIFTMQNLNESLLSQIAFPLEANSKTFYIKFDCEQELNVEIVEEKQKQKKQAVQVDENKKVKQDIPQTQKFKIKPEKKPEKLIKENKENYITKDNEKTNQKQDQLLKQEKIDNEFLNDEQDLKNIGDLIDIIEQERTQNQQKNQIKKHQEESEAQEDLINIFNAINQIENLQPTKNEEIILKNPIGCTTITRKGQNTIIMENRQEQQNFIKMVYDPVLNCYYDPITSKCFI